MSEVDLTTKLLSRKGEVLKEGNEDACLRDALITAVDAQLQGDENIDSKTKIRLFKLGQNLVTKDTISFQAADVQLLLSRAVRIFPPMIYGQLAQILDPGQFEEA